MLFGYDNALFIMTHLFAAQRDLDKRIVKNFAFLSCIGLLNFFVLW